MYSALLSFAGPNAFHVAIDLAGTLYEVPGVYRDDRAALDAAALLAAFLLRK